jgi:hypothetical protein
VLTHGIPRDVKPPQAQTKGNEVTDSHYRYITRAHSQNIIWTNVQLQIKTTYFTVWTYPATFTLRRTTGWWYVVNATPRLLYPPPPGGTDPVASVQEVGWAPGLVWTGAENFALTGLRFPDCPARSESLYRLSYPCPENYTTGQICEQLYIQSVLGLFQGDKMAGA